MVVNTESLNSSTAGDRLHASFQAAVQEIDESIVRDPFDADYTTKLILEKALNLIHAESGQLLVVRGAYLTIRATTGSEKIGTQVLIDDSFCGHFVVRSGQLALADNVTLPPWNEKYKQYLGEMRSELAVPVKIGKQIIGVLNVESPQIAAFKQDDADILRTLSGQAAIALRIANDYDEDREIAEIERAIGEALVSPDKLLRLILDRGLELIGANFGQLLVVSGQDIIILATTGSEKIGTRLSIEESFCGYYVVKTGKAAIAADVSIPPWNAKYRRFLGETMRSELAVPLKMAGHVIGVINMESPEVGFFVERHARILSRLAPPSAIALRLNKTHDQWRQAVHQMKGKVQAIRNAIGYINEDVKSNKLPDQFYIKNISDATDDMGKIVKRILVKVNLLPTQVNDVLENVRNKHPFPSNLKVTTDFSRDEIPLVIADPETLGDVFTLTIENAVHAMAAKVAPALHLQIRYIAAENEVELDIADNGEGIRPEHMNLIFEPFFTTRASHGGTGLGLMFCRSAIDQMFGEIKVRSEVGIGTVFTIVLKGISGTVVTRGVGPVTKEIPALAVLIVDDDDVWSTFAKKTLESRGHRATIVSRYDLTDLELGELLGEHDLVMIDLVRRKKDGCSLLKRLSQIAGKSQTRSTPQQLLVAVDTAPTGTVGQAVAELGVYLYVAKPYTPEGLMDLVLKARSESWMGRL